MSDPLRGVPDRVAAAVERLLPRSGSLDPLLIGSLSSSRARHLDDGRLQELLLDPIREITRRGGKCWRSLLLQACCEAVGGDFGPYEPLLALPELIHVGSLIVDDIQDASAIRRGGPSCHTVYGVSLAINAGTGAYFLAEHALSTVPLDTALRDEIRGLMFEAFRAGHAGQALDIGGLDALAAAVLAGRSPPSRLQEEIETIHWLKAAVPARAFALVGARLGGAGPQRCAALGNYVEAVGMAFQAIDDILNLRGFAGALKQRGEDIRQGKLTLPVAIALERLPPAAARVLWERIRARPQQDTEVFNIIDAIEQCGALDACETQAHRSVAASWDAAAPLLCDVPARQTLAALSDRLLRRHY